jgi:CRISPR system Cascade subunit CasC
MNMQKTAVFGGVKRTRISSQSLKRAMRHSDYYKNNIGMPSDRTRQLGKLTSKYVEALQGKYDESLVKSVMSLISGEPEIKENTQSGAVAAWTVSEVEQYCQLYQQLQEQFPNEKEFEKEWKNATDKKKLLDDKTKVRLFREALQNGQDIALSGRMATSGIMTIVDASLAVAHAITTHTVDTDIDWFTAVDDLNQETGETGSAHLDTTEFSSGVFYRYASLNLRQLQENLGDVDRKQALDIAAHVLHMLATVVPSAKQNAFAAFNLADFALVSFSDQPISLANAFENPVKARGAGFMEPSIKALLDYDKTVSGAYGLTDDKKALFSTKEYNLETTMNMGADLSKLEEWLRNDGN